MSAEQSTCASSGKPQQWDQVDWDDCHRRIKRLQARIVKATSHRREGLVLLAQGFAMARAVCAERFPYGSKGRGWPQGHPLTRLPGPALWHQ